MSQPDRILRWREVAERVRLSRTTCWRLAREDRFPKPIRLTDSATGWRESEIAEWLASRPAR